MSTFRVRFWLTVGALIWAVFFLIVLAEESRADDRAVWVAHAEQMEIKYALPAGLLRAVCEQETNWRNVPGAAGEIGVCQVQAATVMMICPACVNSGLKSTGATVRGIQRALVGHYHGKIDGVFGPLTRAATVAYQKAQGLSADGVVGPRTWAVLMRVPYPAASIATALWIPQDNIEWAARYLVWLQARVSPEPTVMMAAYNGGPANPIVRYMVSVNKRWERI